MSPGRGHKRAKFFEEFERGEYGVRRTVPPGCLEAVAQAVIRRLFEAFSGEGRPCHVAEISMKPAMGLETACAAQAQLHSQK
jgi:hypothetical protein